MSQLRSKFEFLQTTENRATVFSTELSCPDAKRSSRPIKLLLWVAYSDWQPRQGECMLLQQFAEVDWKARLGGVE